MTTEDKIKEAFEAYHINKITPHESWRAIEAGFRAGYMTCLNSLEPTNLIRNTHMLYRLPKGVTR